MVPCEQLGCQERESSCFGDSLSRVKVLELQSKCLVKKLKKNDLSILP